MEQLHKSFKKLTIMCSMSSKELEIIFWLFTIVICKDGPKTKHVNWILNSKLQILGFRVLRKETVSFQEKWLKLYQQIMFRIKKLLKKTANEFLNNAKKVMQSFDESNTFNSDQSGFNYILTLGRTLSEKGERVTLSSVSLL